MKNYLYLIIGATATGTIGIFVKLIGDSIHPFVMNFYRLFFAFIFMLLVTPWIDKTTLKPKLKNFPMYILLGFIFAISLSLTNIAYLNAPIQNVSLISSMFPFFVFIFAYFLLKEKITTTKIFTLIIAIIGLVIINPLSQEGKLGSLLALGVAVVDGLLMTLMRKEDKSHPIGAFMWVMLFGTLFLLPFPVIFGFQNISLWVLLLGLVSSGLAYLFINLALEKISAEVASIISLIVVPLSAIIFAIIFVGEIVNIRVVFGGILLLLAAIYLQTHIKKEKKLRSPS